MAFSLRSTKIRCGAFAGLLYLVLPQPSAAQIETQLIARFGWEQTRMSLTSAHDRILLAVFGGSDLITVFLEPGEATAFADSAERLLRARPPRPEAGTTASYMASSSGGTPYVTLERKLAGSQSVYTFVFRDRTGANAQIVATPVRAGAFVHALRRAISSSQTLAAPPPGPRRPVSSSETYFEFQVEKPVATVPSNPRPVYPEALRGAGTAGEVLVQFVVDEYGRADMLTFRILRSSHDFFTQAVRAAVPKMQFTPAELGGRKVRQLVQQAFHFPAVPLAPQQ